MTKKENKIPSAQEIDLFMALFKKQSEIYELTTYQVCAFYDYGSFLAAVGQENHQTVVNDIVKILLRYNLSSEGHFAKMVDKKKLKTDLNKAISFRKTLVKPKLNSLPLNRRDKRYKDFLKLMDMYIHDLSECNIMTTNIIPHHKLSENVKATKTPIKECINQIIKQFELYGNTQKAKNLIDKLNEPPQ